MQIFRNPDQYKKGSHTVATIGTFDGLHLGHRKIIEVLKETAKAVHGESLVVTFDPHPRLTLYPDDNQLRLLQTLEEKLSVLKELEVDKVLVIPFTKEFSRLSSQAFIRDILVSQIHVRTIIIGYDHQFGKNRTGGISDLQEAALEYQFEVKEVEAREHGETKISSTKIRQQLEMGNVDNANRYLGYIYSISGTVVEGEKLGRKLGFPTANIQLNSSLKQLPGYGVYFVAVTVPEGRFYGMMNIGIRPTVGGTKETLEVNLLDFEGDLYGKPITVEFYKKIRNEEKFASVDLLVQQMHKDEEISRDLIKEFR